MAPRRPTAALGLVYDSGALIAAEANDRRMWALHARALQRGIVPVVPAGCVVEVWRGTRQTQLGRLFDGCDIDALDEQHAKAAGRLRKGLPGSVGPVDATVAEAAVRHRAAVVTSDRSDIEALASAARRRLAIIDI